MGPATKATAMRLAQAILADATEERHRRLAARAETGEFADYGSMHTCPITECYRLCRQMGLHSMASRLANGEFDASAEESDEWANGPEGQEVAKKLSAEMRDVIGLKLNN
jgi:hypothetical protein